MAIPETIREWIDRYNKKAQKADLNYQLTGEARYNSQRYEYETIASAFVAKLHEEGVDDDVFKKRMTNCEGVIGHLGKDTYTKTEVEKLLHDAVYW